MLKKDIGINAGTIWQYLSEKDRLSIKEIEELTNYKESFILLALGWLSRENKIKFSNDNNNMYVELNTNPSDIYY